MTMIKLNVPYLVNDRIANPGEEVDMTDEGRVAFATGMGHAEEVTPLIVRAKAASEIADKDKRDDKDKPMGIFGKPQPPHVEHHDDKKGK